MGKERNVRVSVFGLGYVGTVSAGCLARQGHEVIGVDPVLGKADLINNGRSPVIEAEIDEIIQTSVREGRLRAVQDTAEAIRQTDLSFVCVGTPSLPNGNLDLRYIRHVCEDIGRALRNKTDRHVIVIRSTVLPGTMRRIVIPLLEETSGKRAGADFSICHNPEFLREGTAVKDFDAPPTTVIGEFDRCSGEVLATLYQHLDAPLIRTTLETSEMVKPRTTAGTPQDRVRERDRQSGEGGRRRRSRDDGIFCQDRKLNISPAYLKPGFAFGARACRRICARCHARRRCTICRCRFCRRSCRATKCRWLAAFS